LSAIRETPMNTGVFSVTLMVSTFYRLRVLAKLHVALRPFAGFASTMSLAMSLGAIRQGGQTAR
jgi:hypothetical protein